MILDLVNSGLLTHFWDSIIINKINKTTKNMRQHSNSLYEGSNAQGFGHRTIHSNLYQTANSQRLNASFDRQLSNTQNLKHNHSQCQAKQDIFAKTASKLHDKNFNHHDNQGCLCKDCHCGRHHCKLNVIKPDLTKNTIYRKSFYPQNPVPNIVNHDKQYEKLKGTHLEINTVYRTGFSGNNGDKIQRPRPQDLLHSNGPAANLSSYSSQFPGYRGENQYIKPTERHIRGYFPLRSKSTYSNAYVNKQPKSVDYQYYKDQLKTGSNWFGRSTYSNFFSNPNPEYMAKKVKIVEKKEDNPNFEHQYRTIYKNDFIKKENPLCPSKIQAQTSLKGQFNNTKHKFAQNADFKALSPQFHAISTSKHSYV